MFRWWGAGLALALFLSQVHAFRPLLYSVVLHPRETGEITGKVIIDFQCSRTGFNRIRLDAHSDLNITLDDILLVDSKGKPVLLGIGVHENDTLTLPLSETTETLMKGVRYILTINFEGTKNDALYTEKYLENRSSDVRWYTASTLSSGQVRKLFPCWDDPGLKANVSLTLGRSKHHSAVTQTPIAHSEVDDDGIIWDRFQTTPRIALHSLGFLISPLHDAAGFDRNTRTKGPRIRLLGRREFVDRLREMRHQIPKLITACESYFSIPYPLEQFTIAALPSFEHIQANYWGLIFIPESRLLDVNPIARFASQMTRQWLGHLATLDSSIDSSTAQGIASFLGTAVTQQMDQIVRWDQSSTSALYYEYTKPLRRVESERINLTVSKVHWVMRMLNYSLSEMTMRRGLERLVKERSYSWLSAKQFWGALTDQAWLDETLPEGVTLLEAVGSWLAQDKIPVVTLTRDYENGAANVEQHEFILDRGNNLTSLELTSTCNTDGSKGDCNDQTSSESSSSASNQVLWHIPLMYVTGEEPRLPRGPFLWARERETRLEGLPPPDKYVVINPENIGMYLVNYDNENWNLLATAICSSDVSLHPSGGTRAKLMRDAWTLADAGEIPGYKVPLELTRCLQNESDPEVWYAVLEAWTHTHARIAGTEACQLLEEYEKDILEEMMSKENIDPKLQTRVFDRLCTLGHPRCMDKLTLVYEHWMEQIDREYNIPRETCNIFKWGTLFQWQYALETVSLLPESHPTRVKLLRELGGCPKDREKIEELLFESIIDDVNNTFTDSDLHWILNGLANNRLGTEVLLDYLLENWEPIRTRFANNSELWSYLIYVSSELHTTRENLEKVRMLLDQRKGQLGASVEVHLTKAWPRLVSAVEKHAPRQHSAAEWLRKHLAEVKAAKQAAAALEAEKEAAALREAAMTTDYSTDFPATTPDETDGGFASDPLLAEA